jgi:hypothetical protein
MRRLLCLLALIVIAGARDAGATPPSYVGGQARYWVFSDHNDLRDVLAYWVRPRFHVQLEYWDFIDTDTDDQFRPEIGFHLRDFRHSVYTVGYRHEGHQERFWFGTDQVLTDHFVGRFEVSPIVNADSTEWVVSAGVDYYWGSYNFASATIVRDPRDNDLWVFPLRVRLANEANDWFQVGIAPATRRSFGWAVDGKWHWARAGIERNSRYDFTDRDNLIFTVGFEVPLHRVE